MVNVPLMIGFVVIVVFPFNCRLLKVVVDVPEIVETPLRTTVPVLLVNVPLLLKFPANVNVPEVEVNVPALMVRSFILTAAVPNAKVPAPALVKLKALELITPPMVKTLAVVVMVGFVARRIATAPVPRFNVLAAPMYVKFPWICNG